MGNGALIQCAGLYALGWDDFMHAYAVCSFCCCSKWCPDEVDWWHLDIAPSLLLYVERKITYLHLPARFVLIIMPCIDALQLEPV